MEQKNSLSIPGAIVIAGLLIAGGIYLSKPKTESVVKQATAAERSIQPISNTDHILGNPDAPIVLVEYSDTECPYCKMFQTTMHTIMDTYGKDGKVAWVYRQFPVHPVRAEKEAESTECVNELGGNTTFWKYLDAIFATTTSRDNLDPNVLPILAKDVGINTAKFNECLASGKYAGTVQAQSADAQSNGANGTPFNVMVLKTALNAGAANNINTYIANNGLGQNIVLSSNNKQIVLNGALPLEIVQKILDMILK
jgi:protein-disulfide isomerase